MPTVLNSVVKAAIDFYTKQRELAHEVDNYKNIIQICKSSNI